MQRETPAADVPPWAKARKAHLDPHFVRDSIETVLIEQGYQEDEARAAAAPIEAKCRKATERRAEG